MKIFKNRLPASVVLYVVAAIVGIIFFNKRLGSREMAILALRTETERSAEQIGGRGLEGGLEEMQLLDAQIAAIEQTFPRAGWINEVQYAVSNVLTAGGEKATWREGLDTIIEAVNHKFAIGQEIAARIRRRAGIK
jgi:hypothetical protein